MEDEVISHQVAERIEQNAPNLLKSLPQWVLWKYQHIPGKPKPKKPPFQTNGRAASVDDPGTWSSYGQALTALTSGSGYEGAGFMLDRGIVVIDLDHCLTEIEGVRRITREARKIFDLAHSYTEISPSGKGLHIFLRGKLPQINGQPQDGIKSAKGEMYESKRYVTFTGERVGDERDIRDDQDSINRIYALLKPPEREPQRPQAAARSYRLTSGDAEVIEKARRARNGDKFTRLYHGDTTGYKSKSEAGLALIAMLVYWTNRDAGQVERLFQSSDMYLLDEELQNKWDKKHRSDGATWGQMTIEKAIFTSQQLKSPLR